MKPVEPVKEKSAEPEISPAQLVEQRKAPEMVARPTEDEPLEEISRTIAPSLLQALEKIKEREAETAASATGEIPLGTSCKNATCKAEYQGEDSNSSKCTYHPGVAVFHEGMKYWYLNSILKKTLWKSS